MDSETRSYRTGSDEVVLDLTQDAVEFVAGRGDGLLQVFVPHATAGIAIIETGAGSNGEVVGCVALSRAWLDARERLVDVLVLSPLAVAPDRQRQGIGGRLL